MNIKATVLTLAATVFAFTPKSAVAGDKEAALVGGLIGGIILGAVIADADDHDTRVVLASHAHRHHDHRDDGYWKRIEVRTWVPGYWVSERRHGHTHRYYVEGHYEIRTDRVWVSYDRHHRYDRHDRRDYGYNRHDRRDRDYRR